MRRVIALLTVAACAAVLPSTALAAAADPAVASAIDGAVAIPRIDGRVQLVVAVRPGVSGRAVSHVRVGLLDRGGREFAVARGTHRGAVRAGRRVRHSVVLSPADSRRASVLLHRGEPLRLRVDHRASVVARGGVQRVEAHVASVPARGVPMRLSLSGDSGSNSITMSVNDGEQLTGCAGTPQDDRSLTIRCDAGSLRLLFDDPVNAGRYTGDAVGDGHVAQMPISGADLSGIATVAGGALTAIEMRGRFVF